MGSPFGPSLVNWDITNVLTKTIFQTSKALFNVFLEIQMFVLVLRVGIKSLLCKPYMNLKKQESLPGHDSKNF